MDFALGLDEIRARLAQHRPEHYVGDVPRQAAVAAILRPGSAALRGQPEVLLIQRARREGDPWSGHMAFPGGHRDPGDADLLATALRETLEEVGLDLSQHELLGRLDDHPATARGRFMGMVITPYVFALATPDMPHFTLNEEVDALLWAPLGHMARGEIDTTHDYEWEGKRHRLPAYDVQGQRVWGLTHRMLQNFFTTLERG